MTTATSPLPDTPVRWHAAGQRAITEGIEVVVESPRRAWATSGSRPNTLYGIDLEGNLATACSCGAARNDDPVCKHRAGYYLLVGALPDPAPVAALAPLPPALTDNQRLDEAEAEVQRELYRAKGDDRDGHVVEARRHLARLRHEIGHRNLAQMRETCPPLETVDCFWCNGTGRVPNEYRQCHEPCDICLGTGRKGRTHAL